MRTYKNYYKIKCMSEHTIYTTLNRKIIYCIHELSYRLSKLPKINYLKL